MKIRLTKGESPAPNSVTFYRVYVWQPGKERDESGRWAYSDSFLKEEDARAHIEWLKHPPAEREVVLEEGEV
jgi:hypothetical protein